MDESTVSVSIFEKSASSSSCAKDVENGTTATVLFAPGEFCAIAFAETKTRHNTSKQKNNLELPGDGFIISALCPIKRVDGHTTGHFCFTQRRHARNVLIIKGNRCELCGVAWKDVR
jgi:hypothetical protein